jgi:gas vesicle protein
MSDWLDKLKNDIIDARNKIKELRVSITGGVFEEGAIEAGKHILEISKDTYDRLDAKLSKISNDISTGESDLGDKVKHGASELSHGIKKIHEDIREWRRGLAGGYFEDKTVELLKLTEIRMDELINQLKDDDDKPKE